jgi:redox-sensitive bicupin YhaK (pirin superfamily)
MNTVLHASSSRGTADHGWLKTAHSFSFAGYYNPERIHYGVLRVLNDDWIAGGTGFGKHPHDNMEIVTIPLTGALEHQDSMGNKEVLQMGEVQAMSAGTGVFHSEYNASTTDPCSLLQIWIIPERRGVEPRYEQRFYDVEALGNEWHTVVNPMGQGDAMPIHQQAWFSLTKIPAGTSRNYQPKRSENGVYFFVIEGAAHVAGHALESRDGLGVSEVDEVAVTAATDCFILAMDVPLRLPAIA